MNEEIKLSVVLAVYNKQNSIRSVLESLVSTIENQLNIKNYEIIFVDDASTDGSVEILKQLSTLPNVIVENHTENLGQLKALESGLKIARGRIFVMSSCDLQNPLEKTAELYRAVDSGYDCAIACRSKRLEKGVNSFLSTIFLQILSFIFPKFPKGGFDFVAFNPKVREGLLVNDFDKIFLQLELLKIAERVFQIHVIRQPDHLDHSGWNIRRRVWYAMKVLRYLISK